MRLATLMLCAVLATPAWAAGSPEGGSIPKRPAAQQELKERVRDHIESKIRILQAAHACVSAARNAEAMAVCHAQERKQMKELRDRDRQGVKAGSP